MSRGPGSHGTHDFANWDDAGFDKRDDLPRPQSPASDEWAEPVRCGYSTGKTVVGRPGAGNTSLASEASQSLSAVSDLHPNVAIRSQPLITPKPGSATRSSVTRAPRPPVPTSPKPNVAHQVNSRAGRRDHTVKDCGFPPGDSTERQCQARHAEAPPRAIGQQSSGPPPRPTAPKPSTRSRATVFRHLTPYPHESPKGTIELLLRFPSTRCLKLSSLNDTNPVMIGEGELEVFHNDFSNSGPVPRELQRFSFLSIEGFILPLFEEVSARKGTKRNSFFFLTQEGPAAAIYYIQLGTPALDSDVELFEDIVALNCSLERESNLSLQLPQESTSAPYPAEVGAKHRLEVDWADATPLEDLTGLDGYRNQILILNEDGKVAGALDPDLPLFVQQGSVVTLSQQPADGSSRVVVEVDPLSPSRSISDPWVRRIDNGAAKLEDLISRGTVKLTAAIEEKGMDYKSKILPEPTPSRYDEKTLSRFKKVEDATGTAVKWTGKIIDNVGKAGGTVVSKVMEYHRAHSPARDPRQPETKWEAARRLAGHSIVAAVRVASATGDGAKTVLKSTSETAVDIVKYKKGEEAAMLARSAAQSLTNVAVVYVDARGLARKAILSTVAHSSGLDEKLRSARSDGSLERDFTTTEVKEGVLIDLGDDDDGAKFTQEPRCIDRGGDIG